MVCETDYNQIQINQERDPSLIESEMSLVKLHQGHSELR